MKHLFIDDHEIEAIDNLARVLHQPRPFPGNAVVRPEHLWENVALQIRGAPAWSPEEGVYKMLYMASAEGADPAAPLTATGDPPGESFFCLATSTDGVNWQKPTLGLHDYPALLWNGQPIGTRNNIVPTAQGLLLGPIYDARDPDPERRFKAMGWPPGSAGLRAAVSPDGVTWRLLDAGITVVGDEAQLTHDAENGRFILMLKRGGPYGRSVYLSTSEDFTTWSDPDLVFHADAQDQENGRARLARYFEEPSLLRPVVNRPEEYRTDIYHMATFPYEGLYLGMPLLYHASGKHPPMYENTDGRKTIELTSSRDLRHWNRVAGRAPFMELSPVGDGSAYDTGQLEPANRPIVRNDELWFYYTGLRFRYLSLADKMARRHLDCGAVCLRRLRLDGFVSLRGSVEWGSVLTRPLTVTGRELQVNVNSWRGQVRAELLDADDGQVLPGFSRDDCLPAVIDRIDVALRWKGQANLGALEGRRVRICLWVWQADLYAFWLAGAR